MKKIISILLSVLMAVSMMPLTVFAAEDVAQITTGSLKGTNYATAQEAIDAAVETGVATTVKLLTDTTESIVVPNTNGKTLTLKTSGKTITGVSSSAITVKSGAIVVMNDTGSVVTTVSGKEAISNEFGGKITIGTSSYAPKINRADGTTGYVIKNQGTMIIENATVTNGNANDTSALVANGWYNNDEATADVTLTIKKGTYTSTKGITVKNDAKGVLNISGGTFTHGNNSDNVQNWNIATISGGTFNNRVRTIQAKDDTSIGKTTITGGTFNGEIVVLEYYQGFVGTVGISGGTFATKPNEDFITVSDYWYYQTSAGKYTLTTAAPVVEIDGKQYPSLTTAFAQNNYNGEYTLLADISGKTSIPSSIDKNECTVVLNLNGHTMDANGTTNAVEINSTGADVTINGPGNIKGGKNNGTSVVAAAIQINKPNTKLTINGGNYYSYTDKNGNGNSTIHIAATNSEVIVNDGYFEAKEANGKYYVLNVQDGVASTSHFTVNGGTFKNFDPANTQTGEGEVVLGDGCVSTDNGDGTYTVEPINFYTITFSGKTSVSHDFAEGTPASVVYAWAVANVEGKTSNSTFHYFWKESTFKDVTANKTYSMTGEGHKYTDETEEIEGEFIMHRTCDFCGYKTDAKAVAKVGDKYFTALNAAVNASTSKDDVVTVLADINAKSSSVCKSATIDLNGHTITGTSNGAVEISVLAGADMSEPIELTFKNGSIATTTTNVTGIIVRRPNVTLNIEDVNFNTANNCIYIYNQYKVSLNVYYDIENVTVNVKSGNFISGTEKFALNVNDAVRAKNNKFVVSGGTFKGFDPALSTSGTGEVVLADGCVSTDNGDGTFTVAPAIEASVTLNDDVDVNFFIPNELAESVTVVDADGNAVPFTKDETAGETVVTIETLPAQYSDTFTVKAGDVSLDYSVAEYCQAIIDGEYAEKAQDVCKKLLVFGEYANQYYGYGATGVDITPYDTTATVTTDGIASAQMTQGATGLTLTGATFVAEAKSAVRFYYTMDGASVNDYTVTVSNGSSSIDAYFAYNQDDPTKVFVEVSGIGAKELSTQFDLAITNVNDGSTTTVKYSPLNYAKSAIAANNGASTMAKAIVAYANALDA